MHRKKGKSVVNYNKYGIGFSEGLPLSLCLAKNNIEFEEYNFFEKNLM